MKTCPHCGKRYDVPRRGAGAAVTTPLISDATLAKIVRLVDSFAAPHTDRWKLTAAILNDRLADALEDVRREDPENANLIDALEEANEEAAREHDRREADLILDGTEVEVDAMLRAEGVDPKALGERGAAFAMQSIDDLKKLRTTISRAMLVLAMRGRADVANDLREAADRCRLGFP